MRLVLKQPDIVEVIEKANGQTRRSRQTCPPVTRRVSDRLLNKKKDFVDSLDAKGRQILADLKTPPNCSSTQKIAVPRSKSNIT